MILARADLGGRKHGGGDSLLGRGDGATFLKMSIYVIFSKNQIQAVLMESTGWNPAREDPAHD